MTPAPALIVAAPRSGSGKTIVTLGLLAAWRRQGLVVRAAKSGPDYIDPAFHAAACGAPGTNLDTWAMPPELVGSLLTGAAADADILVVESAMGLFDGVDAPLGRTGAAADLAARFGLPVLLVIDVSGQAQSAAAVVRGFADHAEGVRIKGVVLNRVGSPRHRAMAEGAIAALGIPVLGRLPRAAAIALPERHLGLVQAEELPALHATLDALADMAEADLDLDAIRRLARPPRLGTGPAAVALPPPGQRIALARDAAFSFVYPHLLAGWRRAGAEIVPFSPLADQPPSPDCDVCWLPGGYPELHAGALAAAAGFRAGLRRFADHRPVHGECGGFMALGQHLQDADGVWHAMAGLLGHSTSLRERRMNLGYREAVLLADAPIGRAGAAVRGHEFHYATVVGDGGGDRLVALTDGQGRRLGNAGERRGHVSGTFFHAIASA